MDPDTGTEEVTLSKKWNKHKVGSTIVVDPVRAEWLRKHGHIKSHAKPREGSK